MRKSNLEKRARLREAKNTLVGLSFVTPSAIVILMFLLIPAGMAIHYSFTDWNGISANYNFIGFDNFVRVINAPGFDRIVQNMIFLLLVYIPILNILAILLSVALFDIGKLAPVYKVLIYLPGLLSTVVVGLIWRTIYNPVIGPIARVIGAMGTEGTMPELLGQSSTVMYAMSITFIWFALGFYSLIYMGGLSNIPTDIYEAADIDGASSPKKLLYITLPLLMPSITINVVLSIIGILMEFQLPLVLTGGGPGYASQTPALRAFNYATREFRPGMSMALSVLLTAVAVGISVILTTVLRRREVEH